MKIKYLGYEKKYNEYTGETHYVKNSHRLAVIVVNTNKQSEMDLFYRIVEEVEEEGYHYDFACGDEEHIEAFFEVEDKNDYLYFKRIYMKVKRTKNETTEVEISETTAETETAEEVVESAEETTAPEAEQTAETVETEITEKVIMRLSDGDGNVLGVKIFVGTYKQADEEAERIMAETGCYVSYVRYTDSRWNWMSREYYCGTDSESALTIVSPITMKIEQTENNAENVSETYGGEDVKADTSKTDELSGATKMLMVFRPVVSEYLRQIEYIDTS